MRLQLIYIYKESNFTKGLNVLVVNLGARSESGEGSIPIISK